MTNKKLENETLITQAVKEWYKEKSWGPSYRDLASITGISLGHVWQTCSDLRDSGVLEFPDGVSRAIRLSPRRKK
jgi:DNA-binding transcriptional regulator YhcF (GntR family)